MNDKDFYIERNILKIGNRFFKILERMHDKELLRIIALIEFLKHFSDISVDAD